MSTRERIVRRRAGRTAVQPDRDTSAAGGTAVGVAASSPAAPQLRLRDVSKTYVAKDGPVLTGIDLDVAEGELVSLLGPSGCGKSTLLRIVAGFIECDEGRVELGGRDITRTATHRRGVGIVHQSHALWPHLTVAENIAFGLEMRRIGRSERERRALEMLDLVGLAGYERRLPDELSGGQQQRVALARALVIEPRILLLDEPLSSLDANLRVYLREEIRRLQRELGVTTIFVTHDREEAMAVSDRIVVLEAGRIAQLGTATELYREPASRFVMNFTGATVTFSGTVTAIDGRHATVSSPFGALTLPRPDPAPELTVGETVHLCTRPDDLAVVAEPSGATAALPGRLVDVAFLGTSAEVRVEIDDAGSPRLVPVRLGPRGIDHLPPVGSPVGLAVDAGHVHLFGE